MQLALPLLPSHKTFKISYSKTFILQFFQVEFSTGAVSFTYVYILFNVCYWFYLILFIYFCISLNSFIYAWCFCDEIDKLLRYSIEYKLLFLLFTASKVTTNFFGILYFRRFSIWFCFVSCCHFDWLLATVICNFSILRCIMPFQLEQDNWKKIPCFFYFISLLNVVEQRDQFICMEWVVINAHILIIVSQSFIFVEWESIILSGLLASLEAIYSLWFPSWFSVGKMYPGLRVGKNASEVRGTPLLSPSLGEVQCRRVKVSIQRCTPIMPVESFNVYRVAMHPTHLLWSLPCYY